MYIYDSAISVCLSIFWSAFDHIYLMVVAVCDVKLENYTSVSFRLSHPESQIMYFV